MTANQRNRRGWRPGDPRTNWPSVSWMEPYAKKTRLGLNGIDASALAKDLVARSKRLRDSVKADDGPTQKQMDIVAVMLLLQTGDLEGPVVELIIERLLGQYFEDPIALLNDSEQSLYDELLPTAERSSRGSAITKQIGLDFRYLAENDRLASVNWLANTTGVSRDTVRRRREVYWDDLSRSVEARIKRGMTPPQNWDGDSVL